MMPFETVGIIGLGLIGGSLAKAIKAYHPTTQIIAYNRTPDPLYQAKTDGVIDVYTSTIDACLMPCDILFLCLPVDINVRLMPDLIQVTKSTCLFTDVASTKTEITTAMSQFNRSFIGGHPMTGSEKTGYAYADAMIFENAFYVITQNEQTQPSDIKTLEAFITSIKAIPIIMDPKTHDFTTATISHVPHVIASALVNTVAHLDAHSGHMHRLAAGGFKSLTRIASASPEIWQPICASNQDYVVQVLDTYIASLKAIQTHISKGNDDQVYTFFDQAKSYRDSFADHKVSGLPNYYCISVDVHDETGIIAKVANVLSTNGISIKNMGIVNNREHVCGILEIVFYTESAMEAARTLLVASDFTVY